ncbi:E4 protein [Bos taurus papillomavirus 29]|nr:E4 protein [Bos taurus papillomavirus 29]
MMGYFTEMHRAIRTIMWTFMRMHHVILCWDNGKCILKTKFFLLLLPARFLVGPDDGTGPKPGATPLDQRQPSLPGPDPPHRIPETPGDGARGRSRLRDPDHDHGRDRDRRRGRTPDGERRYPRRPGDPPVEDEEEEEEAGNNIPLEDRLHRLLEKWERDLEGLREKLRADLLSL